MTYHYVYRLDRPSTGEWYVGIRSCRCWPTEDSTYLGSGARVRAILRKHGRAEFRKSILAIVETCEEAQRIERGLVGPSQVADRRCLNLVEGGTTTTGWRHSEETKARIGAGNRATSEDGRKVGKSNAGRTLSPEHKEAIRQGLRRHERTPEHCLNIKRSWDRRKGT